ncbi:MAG: methyltransferase [Flavobacteriales bacterium]|nr:methyltransferase [Flavobacteriales bacterium]
MKIGTDGVLLGAWLDLQNAKTVLDIGSGSGLIAFMLLYRFQNIQVDAVELDFQSFLDLEWNQKNTPWSHQLSTHNCAIQDYHLSSNKTYDHIVSNPPYFDQKSTQSNSAKHQVNLSLFELIEISSKLLSDNGKLSVIIPESKALEFINNAKTNGLYPDRQTKVYPIPGKPAHRALLTLSKSVAQQPISDAITIETGIRHKYTKAYIELTKDFYLNF